MGEGVLGFFAPPLIGEAASLRERVGVRAGDIFSSPVAHAPRAEILIRNDDPCRWLLSRTFLFWA